MTATLSKIDGVELIPSDNRIINGKLSIYFTYKKGQSSIEEKAKFIDWLARILGNSDEEAGYDTHIAMWWMGSKGINGENEPFFTLDVLPIHFEKLQQILSIACDVGETLPFASRANHCKKTTPHVMKTAGFSFKWNRAGEVVIWIATLALSMRRFKSHISSSFRSRQFSLGHMRIIKSDNLECQS